MEAMTQPQKVSDLGSFEGRDVLQATVAVTNAGDGLSKALGVDPDQLALGEAVYVVLECEVAKITHSPIKDTHGVTRIHTLRAGSATLVDEELVRQHLDEQQRRIEESQGVHRLGFAGDDIDEEAES